MGAHQIMLVRHGQTEWNRLGRLHGRSDLPMNDRGRAEAQRLANDLKANEPWDAVICSPLFRARQTAQLIADRLGLARIQELPELVERDYGAAEGRLMTGLTAGELDTLAGRAESQTHLTERALNVLFKISAQGEGQRIIVVTHGALIQAVLQELNGSTGPQIATGSCVGLDLDALANHVAREPQWH